MQKFVNVYTLFCKFQNKFTSLSLAFKTDKLTLNNRLELQQRQRDTAEKNIEQEIKDLKTAIGVSNKAGFFEISRAEAANKGYS